MPTPPSIASVPIKIRTLRRRDVPEVMAIERACFSQAWGESEFERALRSPRSFGLAAEFGGELCGYLIGAQEGPSWRLCNLCVAAHARRRGAATRLVGSIAPLLPDRRRLFALVSERNLPAQLFFRAQHFRAVSIVRSAWPGSDDVYVFEKVGGEKVDGRR